MKKQFVRPCKKHVALVLNLPRHIATHLFGCNHKSEHRMAVGIMFIALGTAITRCFEANVFAHTIMESAGFFVHGIGTVPIVEHLTNLANKTDTNVTPPQK